MYPRSIHISQIRTIVKACSLLNAFYDEFYLLMVAHHYKGRKIIQYHNFTLVLGSDLCLMSYHSHLDRAVGGHLVAARVHHRLALRVVRPVADLYNSISIIQPPRQTWATCLLMLTLLYLRPHSSLYSMVYILSITTVQLAWLELR